MNRKNIISISLAIIILVVAIMLFRVIINSKASSRKDLIGATVRYVSTTHVQNAPVSTYITVNGKLEAFEKIALFAEVPGKILPTGKPFKAGVAYNKGETLLQIDSREARNTLQAQKSSFLTLLTQILPDLKLDFPNNYTTWEKYANAFDLEQALPELPQASDPKQKNFLASRNIFTQYYNIKSLEARLDKYAIKAPFSGVVSMANVQSGSIVAPGQQLGEFLQPAVYEMPAAISVKDLQYVNTGDSVTLHSEDITGTWTGWVKRINAKIDPNSQSQMVYISVQSNQLKEGMYLKGKIKTGIIPDALEVSRKLLLEDQTVYVVQDTLLQKQPVTVIRKTDNTAIISGLKDGTQLLNETFPGAYPGMVVRARK